jgi:REP element-mobilizing transposase RayT
MPRGTRLDVAGALHHVMQRGMERGTIFRDPDDYKRFLKYAGGIFAETRTRCFAWALMPNHVHLLMQTGATPLARVLQRLFTGYAVTFNRRWRRSDEEWGHT